MHVLCNITVPCRCVANLTGARLGGVEADFALVDKTHLKVSELENAVVDGFISKRQTRMFIQSLNVIVGSLSSTERAARVLKRLGEKHHGYGVETDHYSVMGTVLIETIRDVLGDEFSDAATAAWTAAFRLISSIMISASDLR